MGNSLQSCAQLSALSMVLCLAACAGEPEKWGGFEEFPMPPDASYIRVLRGAAPNDLWAATEDGFAYHWDGRSWTLVGSDLGPEPDLCIVQGSDVWAVGFGDIFRWDGARLAPVAHPALPTDALFWGVWGASSDDVWVGWLGPAGTGGVLRWNGTAWREIADFRIPRWGFAPDDAWFAIDGDLLAHWDGATWTEFPLTGVSAIFAVSRTQAWAVGEHQTLFEWNGYTWRTVSPPACSDYHDCADFYAVWATGPDDVWAAGAEGPGFGVPSYAALYHWNGAGWTAYLQESVDGLDSPAGAYIGPLYSVFGFATGEVFTTDGTLILRRVP